MIRVESNDDIYFQVSGDKTRYYDLTSIVFSHPELQEYISDNAYELNRELYRTKEMYG